MIPVPSAPAAPKKPRPSVADSGERDVYGFRVPVGTPMLAMELKCYRENITPAEGGLGAEQHLKNAWAMVWPKYEWSDWVEMLVHFWCKEKWIWVIGHQRASKTFTTAHIAYLDYYASPHNTLTSMATVTFAGLRVRMWSDLMHAMSTASIPQPFGVRNTTNEMRVFPQTSGNELSEKFQIRGMAVGKTADAEGRIKGSHAPRVRLLLDECEDIDAVIYDAMGNPMSAMDTEETEVTPRIVGAAKCVGLANPMEKISRFGTQCEPEGGWTTVTDTDLHWKTKMGGVCIHFDGLQSPNFKQTARVFTGLLRPENAEEVKKRGLGAETVEWWSKIRGWFPPDGMVSRIFPTQIIEKAKPDIIFDFPTEPCMTLDPAFGGDDCVVHFGQKGKLRDGRMAINATGSQVLKFSVGETAELVDHQITAKVIELCKSRGVKPSNFIMDRSGGGRGVFANIHKQWSPEIHGIDYGGSATERPIRSDEDDKCCDIYEKFVTELWYRGRESIADGLLGGLGSLNPKTVDDLFARRFFTKEVTQGTVTVAEPKKEMKARLGRSPDFGDAFVQFGELLIREGHGPGRLKPKATAGTRWQRQRARAVAAGKRYAEATEFRH